jgi:hypothetical protein
VKQRVQVSVVVSRQEALLVIVNLDYPVFFGHLPRVERDPLDHLPQHVALHVVNRDVDLTFDSALPDSRFLEEGKTY